MKRFHLIILVGVLCAFLAVHFIWIMQDGRIPPDDEAGYMIDSVDCYALVQEGVSAFISGFSNLTWIKPALYPCLAVPFYAVFGTEADVALMGVNGLIMIVLVLSIYGIGRYLFDWRVGLVGALVAMCIPELVYQSRVFWPHFGMVGTVAATIFLLLKTEHFTRWGYSLLFGIMLGLAALTRPYLPFYIIAPILWVVAEAAWCSWRDHTRNRTVATRRIGLQILNVGLAFVIAALLAGPFYLKYLDTMLATVTAFRASEAALVSGSVSPFEQPLWYLLHLPENGSLLITVLVIGGTIYAFWRRSRSAFFLLWWFVGGSLALGFSLSRQANFYFTPLYVPIALLGIHWLFQLKPSLRRVLLVVILSLSIGQFFLASWGTPQTATLSKVLRLDGGIYSSRMYAGRHPHKYQTDYDYLLRHTVASIKQDLSEDSSRRAVVSLLTGIGPKSVFGLYTWIYYSRLLDAHITFHNATRTGTDIFDLLDKADYIVALNRGVIPDPGYRTRPADPYTRPLAKFVYSSPPALMRTFVILQDVVANDGTTLRILKRVRPADRDEYKAVFYGVFQDNSLRNTTAYMHYMLFLLPNIWCLTSGEGSMEPLDQGGVSIEPFGRHFQLDDFRIYSKVLSPLSIEKLLQNQGSQEASIDDTALIAYWRFDEGEGDLVSDEIHNYRGRLQGATWTEGKIGSAALSFRGADDHVEIAANDNLNLTKEATISSWIRLDSNEVSNPEIAVIARKTPPEQDKDFTGYAFYVWGNNRLAFVVGNGARRVGVLSDREVPSDKRWHHVAVTFSDRENEVTFYVDGKPAGTDIVTLEPSANEEPLIIGGTRRGKIAPVEIRYPCTGLLNLSDPILSLKIKANDKDTGLNIELHATDGNDYLIRYLPGDGPVSVEGKEITYYLGNQYLDREWHTIERNLEADIYGALGVHFEHVEYLTLSGSSYSVADLEFGTGIPEDKETLVKTLAGVREIDLKSLFSKPTRLPVDPQLGIAVPERSIITSQGFKFEKGEYVINVVAKRESVDGTYPLITISVNDELAKSVPEIMGKFKIIAEEFRRYSTKKFIVYVPRLLSISISVENETATNPAASGGKDKVWIKKILVRKIIQGTDKFTSYTLYTQWQGDRLAFIVGDGNRRVGLLSDRGLGTANKWHHVALTFGMDYKVRFYIDGELAGTDTISLKPFVRTRPLMLGAYVKNGSSEFHFNGVMDDVRIYNKALMGSEIEKLFRQGQQAEKPEEETKLYLVKYWIFGEGGVQTSSAKLGDGDVTLYGNWPKTAEPHGGIRFDGVNDYIGISDLGGSNAITNEFTIAAWVKLNKMDEGRQVLIQGIR